MVHFTVVQNRIVRLFDCRSRVHFVSEVIKIRASADSTSRSLVFNLMVFYIAIYEDIAQRSFPRANKPHNTGHP